MNNPTPFDDELSNERPRVLLVDDDEVNLLLTAAALRERGFDPVEVNSGKAALDALGAVEPDLVVLDALMPGMDGFETCQALRRLPNYAQMPVLMLTGLDDDASITRAYRAGATDFFVKSTQWSLLAGRLRYLLRVIAHAHRTRAQQVQTGPRARPGPHGQFRLAPRRGPGPPLAVCRSPARVRQEP